MYLVFYWNVVLDINQNVWVLILVVNTAIICEDMAVL